MRILRNQEYQTNQHSLDPSVHSCLMKETWGFSLLYMKHKFLDGSYTSTYLFLAHGRIYIALI